MKPFKLKWLIRGTQTEERVDALLAFTKTTSEPTISAVKDYLVRGMRLSSAAALNGIDKSNLRTKLNSLDDVEEKHQTLKQIDKVVG